MMMMMMMIFPTKKGHVFNGRFLPVRFDRSDRCVSLSFQSSSANVNSERCFFVGKQMKGPLQFGV